MARRKEEAVPEDREREKIITTIVVIVAAVLTAALIIGLTALWKSVTARREFLVQPAQISLDKDGKEEMVKKWVRVEEMKRDFLRTDTTRVLANWHSIFKSNLASMTREAYLSSPWVRDVILVRKVFPNRLDIELQLREPYAIIQHQGKYYVVDVDGVILDPAVYILTGENPAGLLPPVAVPDSVKWPGASGKLWSDPSVQAGISMLELCRAQFTGRVVIKQIEVTPERPDAGAVPVRATLVLAAGPRVDWGRTPTSPTSTVEATAYQKTQSLLAILTKEGDGVKRFRRIVVWEKDGLPRVE